MSFLQALQRKKNNLKTTSTIVKTPGGDVILEKKNEVGDIIHQKIDSAAGYVVDFKPDLQVAKVVPGLYMGSQDVTQDESLLQEHSITHILSVGILVPHLPNIMYTFIEALDLPEFNMRAVFEQSSELIDKVLHLGGAVYVHCNAGVSRSATIVIAYLMKSRKLRHQEAYNIVKQARSCIKPNDGFLKQLKLFEEELFCCK